MKVEAIINNLRVERVFIDGVEAENITDRSFCRQVFKLNNLYIKFDNPNDNIAECRWQTKYELQVLNFIKKADLKYFCLPLASGEIDGLCFTVQEEAKHEAIPTEADVVLLEKVIIRNNISDVGFLDFGDRTAVHNCAFTANGWKIYDYAFLEGLY